MAHIHDLIDFTIEAFIIHNNRVLLILHLELNKWLPIGGHIELNEDPNQALFREINEESGLKVDIIGQKPHFTIPNVKSLYTPNFLDIHEINDHHHHIGMIYFLKTKSEKVKLKQDEHKKIKWFSLEELEDAQYKLQEDVKFYAQKALKLSSE